MSWTNVCFDFSIFWNLMGSQLQNVFPPLQSSSLHYFVVSPCNAIVTVVFGAGKLLITWRVVILLGHHLTMDDCYLLGPSVLHDASSSHFVRLIVKQMMIHTKCLYHVSFISWGLWILSLKEKNINMLRRYIWANMFLGVMSYFEVLHKIQQKRRPQAKNMRGFGLKLPGCVPTNNLHCCAELQTQRM